MSSPPSPPIGVMLSGGLDSSILLGHLLREGREIQPFYVRTGVVWEQAELGAVQRFAGAVHGVGLRELVVLDLPLADLYQEHWSTTGSQTPDLDSPDDSVYLPGRNALLLVKPVVWCQLHGIGQLALGVLGTNPFADATPEFFADFESALNRAPGQGIRLVRPFAQLTKREVMTLGRDLPLEFTFSCVAPVGDLHCGACNKCGERHAAFRLIGVKDPTQYAMPLTTSL